MSKSFSLSTILKKLGLFKENTSSAVEPEYFPQNTHFEDIKLPRDFQRLNLDPDQTDSDKALANLLKLHEYLDYVCARAADNAGTTLEDTAFFALTAQGFTQAQENTAREAEATKALNAKAFSRLAL